MNIKKYINPKELVLCVVIALVLSVVCSLVYLFGIKSNVSKDILFRINPGDSISAVADKLKAGGLIDSQNLFKISIKLYGNNAQVGLYKLESGDSMFDIADKFSNGKLATTSITLTEGLTVKQIKELLNADKNLSGSTECVDKNDPVCNLTDGDLFPDTYYVPLGISRLSVLRLSYDKMMDVKQDLKDKYKTLPKPLKTWDDVINLAAIVQKETPKVLEMPTVASVYLNRLNIRMRLQADPTVVYAITNGYGDMREQVLYSNSLKIKNPYNTYTNYGLPPTPIANVGMNAILAVLNPAKTEYLFFVADGAGGHKFAIDFEQHKKNRVQWQKIKKNM